MDRRVRGDWFDKAPGLQVLQLDVDSGRRIPDRQFLRLFGCDVAAEPSHSLQETLRPLVESSDTVAKAKHFHGFTSKRRFGVDSERGGRRGLCSLEVGERYSVGLKHGGCY